MGSIVSAHLRTVAVATSCMTMVACGSDGSKPTSATTETVGTTYQMTMSSLDVPAGGELYKCQDFANPFGKDIAILESKSAISPGSHHFAAFRMSGLTTAPLVDCPSGGLEAHEFVHAAQTLVQDTTYPPDVGRFLPATDGLRLMVHYLNTTTGTLHVEANFSMRYVNADQVKYKAAGVFLNNFGLQVPPGMSSASKSYTLTDDIQLLAAVSHMHRHAISFTSTASDGQMLYQGTEWDEPKVANFDPPMQIASGTTITWTCAYDNETGMTLTFGESAASNEMCIFNGVYYPSADGSSIVQNLP